MSISIVESMHKDFDEVYRDIMSIIAESKYKDCIEMVYHDGQVCFICNNKNWASDVNDVFNYIKNMFPNNVDYND